MTITIGTYILRYAMYLLYNIRGIQSVSGSTSDAIRYNTHTAQAVSRPRYSVDTVCNLYQPGCPYPISPMYYIVLYILILQSPLTESDQGNLVGNFLA